MDIERIAALCGANNDNLRHLSRRLNVEIQQRGNIFQICGAGQQAERAEKLLQKLYRDTPKGAYLSVKDIHMNLQQSSLEELDAVADGDADGGARAQGAIAGGADLAADAPVLITPRQTIQPKGQNQRAYLKQLEQNVIQFALGPAGTGKTFLAVAYAVQQLKRKKIEKIFLTRPAVEAGEHLGFLPGTLIEKINPYLQPLYDALYATLGLEHTNDLIKNNAIEVSALAYMRGRTLDNCLVILDEAQNTTCQQMKMFLTRIGYNSKAIITGDVTQIDLPANAESGIRQATELLKNVEGIGISRLTAKDVVRHPIVAKIIKAYDRYDKTQN